MWRRCHVRLYGEIEMRKDRTFIVAELSANHNHDFELTMKTVEAMAKAGADAVKFQTFKPDSFTMDAPNVDFGPRKTGLWKGWRPIDLYTQGSLPYEWQPKIKELAESLGMECFSTPFDREAVDFLEGLGVKYYKIASLEINDPDLIGYAASKGKPMIMSTGAASEEDIRLAVDTCRKAGNDEIYLLKCTSEYPAKPEHANLLTIPDMKKRFNTGVGVSDHSMTNTIPVAAVALGASIVEKHFILDRSLGGIDSAFSLNPAEFASLVKDIREAEAALGKVDYSLSEADAMRRRSIYVSSDIKCGETVTLENVKSVRPGYGMAPRLLPEVLGRRVNRDLKKGDRFSLEFVD